MISPSQAIAQLERMSGMDFFPRGKDQVAALKELRSAIESAATAEIAEAAVTAIVHDQEECPKPAQLRRAIGELNAKRLEAKTKHCPLCDGSGQETVWLLVTYVGHGLMVRHTEIAQDMTDDDAKRLNAELPWVDGPGPGDNQQLVRSARSCQCRRAA